MLLEKIYPNINLNLEISHISSSSLDIKPQTLFIAIKGQNQDGHDYINDAIRQGAVFIVHEDDININIPHMKVIDSKSEAARIAQIFYNYQAGNPSLIGVTGTDGKTTTSLILFHLLNFNKTASYIGTNGIKTATYTFKTTNTTLNPLELYKYLNRFYNENIYSTVIEVSSEGILDKRVLGLYFSGCIFTNLSHEHLNTHKTMRNYFKTKLSLFKNLKKDDLAVINYDDKYGRKIKKRCHAYTITYGINKGDYRATNIEILANKVRFWLTYKKKFITVLEAPLFGKYNIYNCLGAVVYAYESGLTIEVINERLKNLIKIDGRFEILRNKRNTYIVDFAHTPNALENLLTNLQIIPHNKIIIVLGSAGEKDTSKRQLMGKIACRYADNVIFTSEDPKNENVLGILSDLTRKIKTDYYITPDRKEAIKLAISLATIDDFIVITGKGNEDYENIKGVYFKHNDMEQVKSLLSFN